jgi:biopolymer transport protein ExbB
MQEPKTMQMTLPKTRVSPGSYLIVMAVLLAVLLTATGPLRAQDPAAPAGTKKTTLWQVILKGGPFMFPLAGLSMAGVGLIVNNFLLLQRKKLTCDEILPSLLEQLARRDIDGATQACMAHPCLMTAILEGGLERITTDEIHIESIREGIDLTATAQMSNLIKPVNYLSNIGSIAPLVGLLGTVSGMIKAFQSLGMGAQAGAERMANNISEALVTTAAGLIIAIPCMLFYFWFKNNFMETLSVINAEIGRLLNALQTGATRYVPLADPEVEA